MKTNDVAEEKKALRAKMKALRESLSEAERAAAGEALVALLSKSPVFLAAKTVFCYYGVGSELATHSLLERILAEGSKTLLLPRCLDRLTMETADLMLIPTTLIISWHFHQATRLCYTGMMWQNETAGISGIRLHAIMDRKTAGRP